MFASDSTTLNFSGSRKSSRGLKRYGLPLLLLAIGAVMLSAGGYLHAKALLAQYLIADAWQQSLNQHQPVSPWSWADTYPVAKLQFKEETLYVLSGTSGRVLAFGPGHMVHTPLPGQAGNVVLVGHRDTHFSQLKSLKAGDEIHTQTQYGDSVYLVSEMRIAHQDQILLTQQTQDDRLTLITCYPFDDPMPNTPWRYVVTATLEKSKSDQKLRDTTPDSV